MKAINLMRLIPHINPVRTRMMRMNFSQVTRHISAMPQQVSSIRGRNVGIRATYSLDRKTQSSLWDVGISCHHPGHEVGTEASKPGPKPCYLPPAGRCSWVAWLRMSLSHPWGGFLPWSRGTFLTTNLLLLQNHSGLTQHLEDSCQREGLQQAAEDSCGTFPSPSWHWHWSSVTAN